MLGDAGQLAEARAVFDEGLSLAPDAIVLRLGLGYLHLKANDIPQALATFRQAHALTPARHDTTVALARALALSGEPAQAADLYRQGLTLAPDDAMSRINLAKSLLDMGARGAGEATLRDAVRRDPGLAGRAITALATSPRGRIFLKPSGAAKFLRLPPS